MTVRCGIDGIWCACARYMGRLLIADGLTRRQATVELYQLMTERRAYMEDRGYVIG